MGLCLGKTTSSSQWPYLPPELSGLILARLPSEDDRLSFSAVCRDWRLATQQQRWVLPPAMPCISLSKSAYQSIADGKVRRTSRRVFSFGSQIMYEHDGRIYLRDPSSSVIEIPRNYHWCTEGCDDGDAHDPCNIAETQQLIGAAGIGNAMHKVIMCSSRLVAAIVYVATGRPDEAAYSFAFFRPGITDELSWALRAPAQQYKDIVLYRGKVFALNFQEELFAHELQHPCRAEHVIKKQPPPPPPPPPPPGIHTPVFMFVRRHYMVVSSDGQKLLMVRWSIPRGDQIHHGTINLQVFEADLQRREWSEVKDVDGQVLFLSNTCSRALACSSTELYDQRFRGGNRVFILGIDWARARFDLCVCNDCQKSAGGVPSYCVYDMMSRRLSLVSLGSRHSMRNQRSEWFFPSFPPSEIPSVSTSYL